MGVKHVRLTGGKPLVRKDLFEISPRIARLPGIDEKKFREITGSRLQPGSGLAQEDKLVLRPLMREGATDEQLQAAIRNAIARCRPSAVE